LYHGADFRVKLFGLMEIDGIDGDRWCKDRPRDGLSASPENRPMRQRLEILPIAIMKQAHVAEMPQRQG
jgi:hypothetical protein